MPSRSPNRRLVLRCRCKISTWVRSKPFSINIRDAGSRLLLVTIQMQTVWMNLESCHEKIRPIPSNAAQYLRLCSQNSFYKRPHQGESDLETRSILLSQRHFFVCYCAQPVTTYLSNLKLRKSDIHSKLFHSRARNLILNNY